MQEEPLYLGPSEIARMFNIPYFTAIQRIKKGPHKEDIFKAVTTIEDFVLGQGTASSKEQYEAQVRAMYTLHYRKNQLKNPLPEERIEKYVQDFSP